MFVPLSVLIQDEAVLKTPEDLILALDRWILPKYPNGITKNPEMTKVECLGVLHSFHHAGKFHLRLKPIEVRRAIDAFLEDRLWVDKKTIESISLLQTQVPEAWMAKTNLKNVSIAIPLVLWEALRMVGSILNSFAAYTLYSFYAPRTFTIPKAKPAQQPTPIQSVRKDS